MSPEIKTATETDNRDRLEADADALLSRLARTLESLDRRRHDAFNPKVQIVRHPLISVLIGGSLVALAGGASLLGVYLIRHHRQRLPIDRLRALKRAWFNPERVAHPTHRPIAKELARGVVISVGTYLVSKLAEQALVKLFPKLEPSEAPAATHTATATAGTGIKH